MVYPNNGWRHGLIQGTIATIVAAVFAVSCASPPTPRSAEPNAMVQTLGEVSVSRDGADSVIWLDGLIDPIYSVSTPGDSNLIVVDLVGIGMPNDESSTGTEDAGTQIVAYDGVVDLVTLATYDQEGDTPLTRVEIVLAGRGYPEVYPTDDGLEIRVILGDKIVDVADEPATSEYLSDLSMGEDGAKIENWGSIDEASDVDEMADEVDVVIEITPPPAATQLDRVSAVTTDDGVLVAVEADGNIGSLEVFTLLDPSRLVVDLQGLAIAKGVSNLTLDSDYVSGVRLGSHEGKVRIVLDGADLVDDFRIRQIMPGPTGLWIAIGTGDALTTAMNDAISASEAAWTATFTAEQVPVAESLWSSIADESVIEGETTFELDAFESADGVATGNVAAMSDELIQVFGLHYERTGGMDRTAILANDAAQYKISAPDSTTLVISLFGAAISVEASDRIFPMAGGPVSLIHAFQQPEVEIPEVRVVFTRGPDLEPVVSRNGSTLFVEFEDVGIAAAPPPAFPNVGLAEAGLPAIDVATTTSVATATAPADYMASMDMPMPNPMQVIVEEAMGIAVDPMAAEMAPEYETASVVMPEAFPIEVPWQDPATFEADLATAGLPAAMAAPASVWDAPVEAVAAPAAVEFPAAIEVLEEGGLIDGKDYRGRRVSLDFKDVEIADVLRLIAEVSDLNIIAGDEIAGNVTIRLVEVPWDQALDVILMTKGLGFIRVGNVLRIAPAKVLKLEEEVRLEERRNKEKLEDLEVKLLPVNYATVKDMEGLVKRLLSARGTVDIDQRTNTLIIKDISSIIDEATALIAAIDTQTPQVMIEAKIVEASLDFSRELGTIWGIQTNQFEDAFDPSTPRTDLGGQDFRFIDDNNMIFANPITAIPTGVASLSALILNEDIRIDAQLQAAESSGDGKVISSPRIVTLDNKEARIEQGVSIPFQTFEGGDAKLEFIDAVLSLIVTPHITADESIIMEIEVTRNAPDDSLATPTGSPAIAKNVAETETLVKDGQTLVLGGIYTIIKSQRQSRVPYLHRIPVIGNLFKNNEITDARKELLVFVTPRIIRLPELSAGT